MRGLQLGGEPDVAQDEARLRGQVRQQLVLRRGDRLVSRFLDSERAEQLIAVPDRYGPGGQLERRKLGVADQRDGRGRSGSARPGLPLIDDAQLPAFELATRAVAVRHSDELLGALAIQKPRNEPVTAAEDKLLAHLASQAGLVLRNVRLTAELQATIDDLRASRRRLVRAQDEERQRIERNLHDGAQQQLVALMIQLSLLEDSAEDSGEVRQVTGQLRAGLHAALDDLRALARGIYPPLLADQGLGASPASAGRPRLRCPSWSRPTASGATRGTPRPPCTSASWRPCRTPRNTPARPGRP